MIRLLLPVGLLAAAGGCAIPLSLEQEPSEDPALQDDGWSADWDQGQQVGWLWRGEISMGGDGAYEGTEVNALAEASGEVVGCHVSFRSHGILQEAPAQAPDGVASWAITCDQGVVLEGDCAGFYDSAMLEEPSYFALAFEPEEEIDGVAHGRVLYAEESSGWQDFARGTFDGTTFTYEVWWPY